jgi:hypothetical protein
MVAILISLTISIIVSILWVNAIDKMKNGHPDYRGEDFLN